MHRLELAQKIADEVLMEIDDPIDRRNAYVHLYGVASCAGMLALKRGLNPELGGICGVLHDLYRYKTGLSYLHDQNGAEYMRPPLRDMKIFSIEEQALIMSAIFHHSDKRHLHQPYDELLKDADILQYFLYNPTQQIPRKAFRLEKILKELALPFRYGGGEFQWPVESETVGEDKRSRLADTAESLAEKGVLGHPEDGDFRKICRYWPDRDIFKELKGNWCAAFVYHCCMEAGFSLPIRHLFVAGRFAGVKAWLDWARLPETDFFNEPGDGSFRPGRGDLIVYDRLLSDKCHDHIGVVLSYDPVNMVVAEGNVNNDNKSGIIERSSKLNIAGFIRIENSYRYGSTGRLYRTMGMGSFCPNHS